MSPHISHVLLTALLCLLQTGNGQDDPTTITVTPATLTLMPNVSDSTGGQVTISCRASSVGDDEIMTAINIERVLHASPNADPVRVVAASVVNTDAVLMLTSLQGSATVTGSLNGKTITLTLNRANCGDAGMYICNGGSVLDGGTKSYTSSRNLTIEVNPGPITMTLL
ncbi:uncharacterized protein [Littorina saxatilis]|uniref:uncharacterized protein n=1 Tax=Littorina saxatilis TaxID=31220 RepID=UPI0038B43C32